MQRFRRNCWAFFLLLAGLVFNLTGGIHLVRAQTPAPGHTVYIYLFWGYGCPHCAKAIPYFENLAAGHPEIDLKTYEVYYDEVNQEIFERMTEKYGVEQLAVPTIFIGPYYLQGYTEEWNASIEAGIAQCAREGCVDPGVGVVKEEATAPPTATPTLTPPTPTSTPVAVETITSSPTPPTEQLSATPTQASPATPPETLTDDPPPVEFGSLNQSTELNLPLLGRVDLGSKSLLATTLLVAFVDGFNPCSLWVLTMLLALTLHTGSRKKVLIIGIVFLTVTAGIYALFIAGLFSVLKITSFLGWIRMLVALIALFFGLVNIKDYFWFKEGLSFTIADEKKPGIFAKMRQVMDASQSFSGLVGATVVLAVGVSMVEFSCTAGFPVIWTNILAAQNVSGIVFLLLLLIYMLIYQLDEMIIFFSSVATLKTSRFEEKHGRLLKLISGVLMLTLAAVMLINPALLNDLSTSLLIFGIAFFLTLAILFAHRYLFPKLGLNLSSDTVIKETKTRR